MANVHDFNLKTIAGVDKSLGDYKGKTLLLVNVASKCGLTPQYKGLEALHGQYGERGFAVLGFPCNQFGGQEPGTEAEIQSFCTTNFGVSFDMFSKIDVNGDGQDPLYAHLTGEGAKFPGKIGWNFEKFLVNGDGEVVERFSPRTAPEDPKLVAKIEATLG